MNCLDIVFIFNTKESYMAYPNFRKNHNKKNLKSKNKMLIGRKRFTEPLIISGKYFGIKLLSVYEFMNCLKMKKTLDFLSRVCYYR